MALFSDHCAKKLLEWFDGMLEADEEYFKVIVILYVFDMAALKLFYSLLLFLFQQHGDPLFSSHMLDLSEEFDEENIATCAK